LIYEKPLKINLKMSPQSPKQKSFFIRFETPAQSFFSPPVSSAAFFVNVRRRFGVVERLVQNQRRAA
jgi:hypothetical protein